MKSFIDFAPYSPKNMVDSISKLAKQIYSDAKAENCFYTIGRLWLFHIAASITNVLTIFCESLRHLPVAFS